MKLLLGCTDHGTQGTSFTPVQRKFHDPVYNTNDEHEVVKYVYNNAGQPESTLLSNKQIVMLQELVDHDKFPTFF